MGWATDSAIEVFKKSFDYKNLYWNYFLISLLGFVLLAIISAVIILIPAYIILAPYIMPMLQMDPDPMAVLFALQSFIQALPQIIMWFAAIYIIFIIVATLLDSFISGLLLNIALDYLKKAKFSIGRAIEKTTPRLLVLFAINIIFVAILGILQIILILPAIISSLNLLNSLVSAGGISALLMNPSLLSNIAAQITAISAQIDLGNLINLIILFFISPFLLMIAPVALFEKRGVSASLGRIIELGKKSYLPTLGYLLLLGLLAIIGIIVFIIAIFISLLLVLVLIGIPLLIVVLIAFALWLTALSSLATAKLYLVKASMK